MTRILTVASLLLVAVGPAAAQPPQPGPNSDAKVAALLAAWEKTRNELPVLKYTWTQKQYWPAGQVMGQKLTERRKEKDIELVVHWKTGRYRMLTVAPDDTGRGEFTRETVTFDGKEIRRITELLDKDKRSTGGLPRDGGLVDGDLPSLGASEATHLLQYISVGLLPIGLRNRFTEELFPPSIRDYIYFERTESVNSRAGNVFLSYPSGAKGSESRYEIVTDPARDSWPVRFRLLTGNSVAQSYGFSHMRVGDHWLPSAWSFEAYSGTRLLTSMKADPIRLDLLGVPSDSTFTLEFPDGLIIERRTVPRTNGARPSLEQTNPRPAVSSAGEVVDVGATSGRSRLGFLIGTGVAVLLLGAMAILFFRRKRFNWEKL